MNLEDLKKEVELLERKVELTKQYLELMEKCRAYESLKRIEYVPYPVYPSYPQWSGGINTGDFLPGDSNKYTVYC